MAITRKNTNEPEQTPLETTPVVTPEQQITTMCRKLQDLLLAKNSNYGNSALTAPALRPGISAKDALLVRMSDKIARLRTLTTGTEDHVGERLEDTIMDLAGYCMLYLIAK